MKRLFSATVLSLALLSPAVGHAGALDMISGALSAADLVLGVADKALSSVTDQQEEASSPLTQLNYSEPMGFTGTMGLAGSDEYYLTIYNGKVHLLTFIGDARPALLFKITQKTPTTFIATCIADVSEDMWHKKYPNGTLIGTLSQGKLIVSFSNADITLHGEIQPPVTLTQAKDGVREFVQQRKQFFESDAKMSTKALSWENMIQDKQLADYEVVTLSGKFEKDPNNGGMTFYLKNSSVVKASSKAKSKLAKDDPYYLENVTIMTRYDEFRSLQAPNLEKAAKSLKLKNGDRITVTGRLGKFALQGDDALIFYGDSPITIKKK